MEKTMYYLILLLSLNTFDYIKPIMSMYDDTWESLDSRPFPKWFFEAKIGILINWGLSSVFGLDNDFYWSHWKRNQPGNRYPNEDFMTSYFNKPGYPFQDISRHFTAEFYNATEWVTLFKKSGAKYVILTVKHHDGYSLWPSNFSSNWNSITIGPQKDLTGELSKAISRIGGLRFGIYMAVEEFYNSMYISDKANGYKTDAYTTYKFIPQMKELINTYYPEILYSHCCYSNVPTHYLKIKEFIAWLYNRSPVRNTVAISNVWGQDFMLNNSVFCTTYIQWLLPPLTNCPVWIDHIRINKKDMHYFVESANLKEHYTAKQLIVRIVKGVTAGKLSLIHILPLKDGTLPLIIEERLLQMGEWLAVNGEAIYGTEKWDLCRTDEPHNIWYTRKNTTLYAFFFDWPKDNKLILNCATGNEYSFSLLGVYEVLKVNLQRKTTTVYLCSRAKARNDWVWTIRINNYHPIVP